MRLVKLTLKQAMTSNLSQWNLGVKPQRATGKEESDAQKRVMVTRSTHTRENLFLRSIFS